MTDELRMGRALCLAAVAVRQGDRPFGAVVFDESGEELGAGWGTATMLDPTRHSEMDAIRAAARSKRGDLDGCTVYSTHEPCTMCAGAIIHAKPDRVVFGSRRVDIPQLFRPRRVSASELIADQSKLIEVVGGVRRAECIHLFDEEVKTCLTKR